MEELHRLDKVAYIRFASVYRSFQDVQEFMNALSTLLKTQPRTLDDLTVQVAIVRPGPIKGGMVHPYLKRRQGMEPVTYPSAAIESAVSNGAQLEQEMRITCSGFADSNPVPRSSRWPCEASESSPSARAVSARVPGRSQRG